MASVLENRGLTAVDLIGHSLGGSIALVLAERHPSLVGRLIVAEPNLDAWDGDASVVVARQSEAEFVESGYERLIASADPSWATTLRECSPVALHRTSAGLCTGSEPVMRDILMQLAIPRTFIVGDRSPATPGRAGLESAGVKFVTIPDAGHVMMEDSPEAFAAAVDTTFA